MRTATLDELAFMQWLYDEGYILPKPLIERPGYWSGIKRLAYHYSLQVGLIGDKVSVEPWCYTDDLGKVLAAQVAWNGAGEPAGWQRHPGTGRRRPDGDPAQEYIRW